MYRLLIILLFICFSGCTDPSRENSVAICCVFQDDSKYLPEWIEFHENQGVSHFYLYNNLSPDDWNQYLKPYIDRGLVEVIDWPYESQDQAEWNKIQSNSYMHCIKNVSNSYTWLAFLDTDEFLFVVNGHSLPNFLRQYRRFPGVMVNWVMYGTSHVPRIPDGEKMLDHLVWRAPIDYEPNKHFKSIVRPKEVKDCLNPHFFIYEKENLAVDENMCRKRPEEMDLVSVEKLRINHYWSRDMEFFHKVKLPRRVRWYNEYQRCIKLESEMNEEYDPILKST